jgi:hypothetical protein
MKPIFLSLFTVLIFIFSPCAGGWGMSSYHVPGDSIYSAEALIADLDELKAKILEIHPNPFTYCTEYEFNAAFEAAKADVSNGMSYYNFAAVVGSTLRIMRDSHSLLEFQSIIQRYKKGKGRVLDINVVSIADSIYVRHDEKNLLPPGSKLLRIGGSDAKELHENISRYSLIEGESNSGFIRVTDAIYGNFAGLFVALSDTTSIVAIHPTSGDTLSVVYPARTLGGKKKKRVLKQDEKDYFSLTFLEGETGQIAHLMVGSFADLKSRAYHRFLKRSFREIKKRTCTDLVIDLRDNTGGRSARVKALMLYISDGADIGVPANMIAKQSESSDARYRSEIGRLPRFLIKKLSRKGSDGRKFIDMVTMPLGTLDTVYFNTESPREPKHAFNGNKTLLMNGLSGSGSVIFSGIFATNQWGPILGEPCLGPVTGTWGNPVPVKLENTGLGVFISSMRFNVDNAFKVDPKPVMPTVFIYETPLDLSLQRDACIEHVKQQND